MGSRMVAGCYCPSGIEPHFVLLERRPLIWIRSPCCVVSPSQPTEFIGGASSCFPGAKVKGDRRKKGKQRAAFGRTDGRRSEEQYIP